MGDYGEIIWNEIGRVSGLYLRLLRQLDNGRFIAAGNETETTEEGFTVPSSGIWEIVFGDDLANILESG